MVPNQASMSLTGTRWNLVVPHFETFVADLSRQRLDPVLRGAKRGTKSGQVFSFIKGLRVSAGLIYLVRHLIGQTDSSLEVSWGQIIAGSTPIFSPECDVIIHERGTFARWNGNPEPVMDFKLIDCDKAIAVISCKSELTSIQPDLVTYCDRVKEYVNTVLLFAECCRPGAGERLQERARSAGYQEFWHLYTWDAKTSFIQGDEASWKSFAECIWHLATSSRAKRSG